MQFVEANGATIPAIGLGTWELRGNVCARIVERALRMGYRHVDTAEAYDNEREVGEGLRASGVTRADVFVTTKVWSDHLAPREFERATKESLTRLRLSELDLLLIHWPSASIPLAETIGALCRMKSAGLTRHIGVSNFTVALVAEAVQLATEPLVVDQIEWHPFIDQSKVRAVVSSVRLGGDGLQPHRPRPDRRQRRARTDRGGARQNGRAGQPAFPDPGGRDRHPAHLAARTPRRKPGDLRFRPRTSRRWKTFARWRIRTAGSSTGPARRPGMSPSNERMATAARGRRSADHRR